MNGLGPNPDLSHDDVGGRPVEPDPCLPHLIVSYAPGIGVLVDPRRPGERQERLVRDAFARLGRLVQRAGDCSVLPFALEAMAWSSGVGPLLAALPAHPTQWPYLVGCSASRSMLAGVGAATLGTNLATAAYRLGLFISSQICDHSLTGGGDSFHLFLRLSGRGDQIGPLAAASVLVVAKASVGLQFLFDKIPLSHRRARQIRPRRDIPRHRRHQRAGDRFLRALGVAAARRRDVSLLDLSLVRALPSQARFVLLPPDQQLAAMLGRKCRFRLLSAAR